MQITYTPLAIYDYQRVIYSDARNVLVEASTKVGKTVCCMDWQIQEWLSAPAPGEQYATGPRMHKTASGIHMWCAQTYSVALLAFERACRWLAPAISAGAIKKHEGGAGKKATLIAAGRAQVGIHHIGQSKQPLRRRGGFMRDGRVFASQGSCV